MPERSYINMLTQRDRVIVRKLTAGRLVIGFAVQYQALIRGHWRNIESYDNSHGYPHRHVYYPSGDYKQKLTTQDNNRALTECEERIKSNFRTMRERYIILLDRDGGGHE